MLLCQRRQLLLAEGGDAGIDLLAEAGCHRGCAQLLLAFGEGGKGFVVTATGLQHHAAADHQRVAHDMVDVAPRQFALDALEHFG